MTVSTPLNRIKEDKIKTGKPKSAALFKPIVETGYKKRAYRQGNSVKPISGK